jgi:small subunit ribosomal protein S1
VQVGDTITALVVRVDNENGRISLSTRKLEANSGDMLRDPQRVYDNAEVAAAEWRERGPPPMFGHQEDDM